MSRRGLPLATWPWRAALRGVSIADLARTVNNDYVLDAVRGSLIWTS
jgi:hypothetical protein